MKKLIKIIYEAKEKKPAEFWAIVGTVLDTAYSKGYKDGWNANRKRIMNEMIEFGKNR